MNKMDRLEPSMGLMDVGKFEDISVFPKVVTFWRQSGSKRTYHRNPLLDDQLGTSLSIFGIDSLHTVHFLSVLVPQAFPNKNKIAPSASHASLRALRARGASPGFLQLVDLELHHQHS